LTAGIRRIFAMGHRRVVTGLATAVVCVAIAVATSVSTFAQRERVRIHVSDVDSGLPIMHARLASVSAAPLPPTITDEHGDVTVDVPAGGRTVRIGKAGYAPESVPLMAGRDVVDVKLARGAAITGRVVDALGVAVAGQSVRVTEKVATGARPQQTTTNDLGEYRIGALPQGTYAVALASPASRAASADAIEHIVTVRRGDDVGGIDFIAARAACVKKAAIPTAAPMRPWENNASILGRVVNAGGMPISCVEVVAYRGPTRAASGMTDVDGRYALTRLQEGAFQLEFRRDGYVPLQWGQQQRGAPGRSVQVRRNEQLKNIDIALPHGGAVTGTLLDEFLEPAENVTIRAMELRGDEDRPMAVGAASGQTDDRGRYRLSGLAPGRYIVASVAGTEPPDPRTGKGYAPAYYPGVMEIASAMPIDVHEEQEHQWVDFPREPVRVATISGVALNSRNEPITDRVLLVASQRSGAVIAETQGADVKGPDGTFTIPNVPPGDYVLQATSKRPDATPEFGMQYVTVYQEDPPPVRVKTAAGLDVQGRLIEEGSPLVDPRSFGLTAIPVDWDHTSVLAGLVTLTPANDGTLTLGGVTGPRRFVLTAGPSSWYLKAIRIRGRDVTDEVTGFPLSGFGSTSDLEVVVSNKGAIVEGDAMDASTPATDFSVVLFSSNPDHWFHNSRFLKSGRATRGRFRIEGIADGDYFIAAVDLLDGTAGGAWQDRDFLQSLITGARRVRLREGDDRSLT